MTATRNLQIGRITTAADARTHMAISGRTPCGSAGSSPINHPATTYRGIDKQNLCRRCFTPANLTRAQSEVTNAGRFNAALDNFLCDVRLIVGYGTEPTTAATRPAPATVPAAPVVLVPGQRPALTAFLARQAARTKTPPQGSWGQLASEYAATHPTTARAAA